MNDSDREEWVSNDEGLYNWWKSSGQPMRRFIRENRAQITEAIEHELHREPPAKSWRDYC